MTERKRLIELILECDKDKEILVCFKERPRKRQAAEILADHLLSNGVIVPPCIEGTTVYKIYRKCKGSMDGCLYNGGFGIWRCHYKNECRCDGFIDETKFELCMLKDVGKTVFLTREEAEKALKEYKSNARIDL